MTVHQAETFAILGIMLVLFASDRLRHDFVRGLAPTLLVWRLR